jgi:hypothetical protein
LAGVSLTSIVFADRPVRAAGHLPTEALLEEWTTGDFTKDAPNATVSVLGKDGVSARDVVVELKSPHLEGDRLTLRTIRPLLTQRAAAAAFGGIGG